MLICYHTLHTADICILYTAVQCMYKTFVHFTKVPEVYGLSVITVMQGHNVKIGNLIIVVLQVIMGVLKIAIAFMGRHF